MAFAQVALGQIKSLRQSAVPRNYEIWYVYATGYNLALNKAINETLAQNGKLTESDLEQIYESHLSQIRISERIDSVGSRVIGEIDEVMDLITEALGNSSVFGDSLSGAVRRLSIARDRESIVPIVEALVKSTRAMQDNNRALESRLLSSKEEISTLQQSLEAIRAESLTDPLTSLGNRKYFDRSIDEAIRKAFSNGESLSLAMIDIDHFKAFNDSFGHPRGDEVLRSVARLLSRAIRDTDIAVRYGGEEFAIVLPNTDPEGAAMMGERLRLAIEEAPWAERAITISVGAATATSHTTVVTELLEHADRALYRSKQGGRNRVTLAEAA